MRGNIRLNDYDRMRISASGFARFYFLSLIGIRSADAFEWIIQFWYEIFQFSKIRELPVERKRIEFVCSPTQLVQLPNWPTVFACIDLNCVVDGQCLGLGVRWTRWTYASDISSTLWQQLVHCCASTSHSGDFSTAFFFVCSVALMLFLVIGQFGNSFSVR